jgi:hypothetical protein
MIDEIIFVLLGEGFEFKNEYFLWPSQGLFMGSKLISSFRYFRPRTRALFINLGSYKSEVLKAAAAAL